MKQQNRALLHMQGTALLCCLPSVLCFSSRTCLPFPPLCHQVCCSGGAKTSLMTEHPRDQRTKMDFSHKSSKSGHQNSDFSWRIKRQVIQGFGLADAKCQHPSSLFLKCCWVNSHIQTEMQEALGLSSDTSHSPTGKHLKIFLSLRQSLA